MDKTTDQSGHLSPQGLGPDLTVGFLSPGWPPGSVANGIVTYIANLIEALRNEGTNCVVLTAAQVGATSDPSVRYLHLAGNSFWSRLAASISWRLRPVTWHARALASRIHEEIARLRFDLIEMEESFGWAHWLALKTRVPVVVRLHGPWFIAGPANGVPQDTVFRARVHAEGVGIASASAISAPSAWVLEQVRSYYASPLPRAEVIPNAIDVVPSDQRWSLAGCERNLILFVGRFDRHKGGDLVIDAFARLSRELTDLRLLFVGPDRGYVDDDGGRRWQFAAYLEDRIPGLAERARVEYLGSRPHAEIAHLRRRAHVTVVSSRYENFAMTVLEAMAMGCPLVVSDAGGLPEMIVDGESALTFRSGVVDELSDCIRAIISDDALAMRLGREAARTCADRYSPAQIARRTREFYRRIVGERRR